jgi:hypothetical protein
MQTVMFLWTIFLFFGCGGNIVQKSSIEKTKYEGYVIDSPVVNLTYKCDNKFFKTEEKGFFTCTSLPVTFYVAGIEIGSIYTIATDRQVYIQDIIEKSRSNFTDKEVLKLALLLQSLDDDKNITKEIRIDEAIKLNTTKKFTELTIDEIKELLRKNNIKPVSEKEVENHLREFSLIDTLKPVIQLIGSNIITLYKGSEYIEQGARAIDDRDKNLTITTRGTINSDKVGEYC